MHLSFVFWTCIIVSSVYAHLGDGFAASLFQQQATERPVVLQNATATFSQIDDGPYSAESMIDGITSDNIGWGIHPDITDQTAVFETKEDIGTGGVTSLTFSLLFNVKSVPGTTGHTLGRFRLSATTDSRDSFADGEQIGGDVSATWSVLDVVSAGTTSGASISKLADGSLLVSGKLREDDLYTIETTTRLARITGVRLEAMTDPSLPHNGPGREPLNGNFHVAELIVKARELPSLSILSQPNSLTLHEGETAEFAVSVNSSSPLTYQWFRNGVILAGATNPVASLQNISQSDAGTYWVILNNGFEAIQSAPAVLSVTPPISTGVAALRVSNRTPNDAPILNPTGQPLVGANFLVQVYATTTNEVLTPASSVLPLLTGTNAGYFEPVDLLLPGVIPGTPVRVAVFAWDGSTGPSYETAVANGGANGSSLVVTNTTGTFGQTLPLLEGLRSFQLVAPARILAQPASQSVFVGQTAAFRVDASGEEPLTYEWRFNRTPIPGARSATLFLTNVQLAQAGEYSVVVSNRLRSILSEPATLRVESPDTTRPMVIITSPEAGSTTNKVVNLTGTITDDQGIASARWEQNGASQGPLSLENGNFSVTNVTLVRGVIR